MPYLVMLNARGERPCLGSDSVIPLTGRWPNPDKQAAEYRDRFKIGFPHKYEEWTHYAVYHGSLLNMPDKFVNPTAIKEHQHENGHH